MPEDTSEVVMFGFVEAIHVELPHKAVHFVMSKEAREDDLFKFDDIAYNELSAILRPKDNFLKLLILFKWQFTESI